MPASHHNPYRLTCLQRRVYIVLVSEAMGEGRWLDARQVAARIRRGPGARDIEKVLDALQWKLPLIPERPWKIRRDKRPGENGRVRTAWMAVPKPARRPANEVNFND